MGSSSNSSETFPPASAKLARVARGVLIVEVAVASSRIAKTSASKSVGPGCPGRGVAVSVASKVVVVTVAAGSNTKVLLGK